MKSATGAAADPAFEYAVSYNTDPPGTRTTRILPVGDPQLLDDVETGADTLETRRAAAGDSTATPSTPRTGPSRSSA